MFNYFRKLLIIFSFLCFFSILIAPITHAVLSLDIKIDTGAIYFRGEFAEFYILTSYNGSLVNVTFLSIILYRPDSPAISLIPTIISIGLYKITYQIPINAIAGTYVLVVTAKYSFNGNTVYGSSLKSFLISDKLTSWDAKLLSIENKIATIQTDINIIKVNISNINARIISISGRIATIETDIGTIKSDIGVINGKISFINGTLVKIKSDLGMIETDLNSINGKLKKIDGDIVEIQTDIQSIYVTLNNINARIVNIENNTATILTDVGIIRGKIVKIEGNVMFIQTDIGEVKITIPKEFEVTRINILPPVYIAAVFAIITTIILIFPIIKKRIKKKYRKELK